MLEKNLKKCLKSRIYIDFKKGKRKRRSWYKKNNYQLLLRKPWSRHITRKERDACLHCPIFPSSVFFYEHFSNGFLPTTPASQPLDSWTAESDGPQPILTGGRNEGGSPSSGSSFGSLLPGLTSHVRQKSTESNISFPFSSFGSNSSPGWNGGRYIRDVTKWFLHI